MCEKCKERAERALRQGTGFRVTPGEAAKLEEIAFQIEELFHQIKELEKKKDLWWEKQLFFAGFGEGDYQYLPTEGVIVRKESEDMDDFLDYLEELVDEIHEQWRNPNLRLI